MTAQEKPLATQERRRSRWREVLGRLPVVPLIIILGFCLMGILAPLISPHDPLSVKLAVKFLPPAWMEGGNPTYFLGTDGLGRDLLSRMIHGARVSLMVMVSCLLTGGGVGLTLGILAGYSGGITDTIISRLIDAMLSLPSILIALAFAIALGPGIGTVILAITILMWSRFARVIRGDVLSIKERDFVDQAIVCGARPARIMATHIFPNTISTFMVLVSLNAGYAITIEASLSFLGAGIPPPTPSWGSICSDGRAFIRSAWWISILPGAAITLLVLALNLFGDWLRDWLDPKLRQL